MVTRDLPKDSREQGGAALATITTESGLLMSKTRIREHERERVCVLGGMVVVRHNSWGPCGFGQNPHGLS